MNSNFIRSNGNIEALPSTSIINNNDVGNRMEYFLIFSDSSILELSPKYSKHFGMVEDFAKAMALKSLKAEIPMPKPFTKEAVEIILGYLKILQDIKMIDSEAAKYFYEIPVSKCIAALNTAEFMICNDFIKICSVNIAKKLKDLDLINLAETCNVKNIKANLEKFKYSPSCWILFGETLKEIFGKEPDWEGIDSSSSMDLSL